MAKWSNYAEGKIIGHVLRNDPWTAPSALYLALHTGDPGETGANELSGGGYTRKLIDGGFAVAASRATSNSAAVTFSPFTAAVGTITYLSIWDAESGGNLICYSSALSTSIASAVGGVAVVAAGDLDISFSGEISTYLANKMLDHIFGVASYTTPGTSIYTSLHTVDPGLTGASEVSGNAYARVQVTAWDSPTDGATANTNAITYPTPTPSDWGTITHKGIWDAASGGNFLIAANLDASLVTASGTAPVDNAGEFDVVVQ